MIAALNLKGQKFKVRPNPFFVERFYDQNGSYPRCAISFCALRILVVVDAVGGCVFVINLDRSFDKHINVEAAVDNFTCLLN